MSDIIGHKKLYISRYEQLSSVMSILKWIIIRIIILIYKKKTLKQIINWKIEGKQCSTDSFWLVQYSYHCWIIKSSLVKLNEDTNFILRKKVIVWGLHVLFSSDTFIEEKNNYN